MISSAFSILSFLISPDDVDDPDESTSLLTANKEISKCYNLNYIKTYTHTNLTLKFYTVLLPFLKLKSRKTQEWYMFQKPNINKSKLQNIKIINILLCIHAIRENYVALGFIPFKRV